MFYPFVSQRDLFSQGFLVVNEDAAVVSLAALYTYFIYKYILYFVSIPQMYC